MTTTPDTEVKPTTDGLRTSTDDLETILSIAANGQSGRITPHELRSLVAVYRAYEPMREALTEAEVALRWAIKITAAELEPGDVSIFSHPLETVRAALSTLPVNDRHHSGSDSYQAGASAPALSEKVNARSEWLPIESAPHGPNLILAFRNDAGKWRRVIGWHAKQFEIEVDADELHSGLEEGPAGEAIYAKSGWYEYLDADEAPCNRIWPSHWMPLPSPPDAELNFSNNAERDGVSLKPDTSSQPASEAGKLSTDTGEVA